MIDLTKHEFRKDKFYKDHWVSRLGSVVSRAEAERIIQVREAILKAKAIADAPAVRKPFVVPVVMTRGEHRKESFEKMRESLN